MTYCLLFSLQVHLPSCHCKQFEDTDHLLLTAYSPNQPPASLFRVHQTSDLRTVKNQLWQSGISRILGLEFLQVLLTADQRFRNGRKLFLKRLGVSTGFPVSLCVSGF
jgi:hypothetical protein